jgi:hypothetical protein
MSIGLAVGAPPLVCRKRAYMRVGLPRPAAATARTTRILIDKNQP